MDWFINFIFRSKCEVCGQPPEAICAGCAPKISPRQLSGFTFPVVSLGRLDGDLEKIIIAYKDDHLVWFKRTLINQLRSAIETGVFPEFDCVVVPARNPKNYKKRGFDPTLEITKGGFGKRVTIYQLTAIRKLGDQRVLSAADREQNLKGAFKANIPPGLRVLLFDDVHTTGATMREMTRAVEQAGAKIVAGCVLAETISVF